MNNHITSRINLPALKGQVGDWFYYVTIMTFEEVANRVKLPKEIDEYNSSEKKLGEWIQREIDPKRMKSIVDYLNEKEQRFFNSLILGIYGGHPSWQELSIKMLEDDNSINEDTLNYMERTFGILTLNGDESIFAIDGQHRAIGIRQAVSKNENLLTDEITVLFLAHKTDSEGLIRTRRLFSTLNRYAKPVNKSEIITLSEDDNCAIITRNLIENYPKLIDKVLLNKSKVISPENTTHFTNVILLYDNITTFLSDKSIGGHRVKGISLTDLTTTRQDAEDIQILQKNIEDLFDNLIISIPSLTAFFNGGSINRKDKQCSLLFRPIGQNILFSVLKVALSMNKFQEAIDYFAKDDFNLNHSSWGAIFWDSESNNLSTDKGRQYFAIQLILEKIGAVEKRSPKIEAMFENYSISATDI